MTGLLIFIGLILIILNVLSIKKQKKSFNGVLGNAIGNIHDYDIAIGELRREFSESILGLQSELMDIKETIDKNNDIIIEKPITTISNNANSSKVEDIKKLISEGCSTDEVSEIMHLGKGEVLLIKDLYIR